MGKVTEIIKKLQVQKKTDKENNEGGEEVLTAEDKKKREGQDGPRAEKCKKEIAKSLDDYVCDRMKRK